MWPIPTSPLNYAPAVAVTLFSYDYILTIRQEIDYFWRAPGWSGAMVLFFANRYLHVLHYILVYVEVYGSHSCDVYVRTLWGFTTLVYVPWAAFNSMRTYALSQKWVLAALVFVLSMMPLFCNLAQGIMGVQGMLSDTGDCFTFLTFPYEEVPVQLTILSRSCLVGAEAILLAITWKRLYSQELITWRSILEPRRSLTDILLRDGTLYFFVLFALNLLHVTFTATEVGSDGADAFSIILTFTDPLTTIFVSHLLIDLQASNAHTMNLVPSASVDTHDEDGSTGTIAFNRAMWHSFGESFVIGAGDARKIDGTSSTVGPTSLDYPLDEMNMGSNAGDTRRPCFDPARAC